jgi:hypothetical protein
MNELWSFSNAAAAAIALSSARANTLLLLLPVAGEYIHRNACI